MVETLSILSVVSFVASVVCLALAMFLWFFWGIPTVIGDLNGSNARKSIAKIRTANERSGIKAYHSSVTNIERGKITGKMRNSGKLKKSANNADTLPETGLLSSNAVEHFSSEETAILKDTTTELLTDKNETVPLSVIETIKNKKNKGKKLEIIEEIVLVHTAEVIE